MKRETVTRMNIAYNEDCVQGMRKLPDACIDLTVTSPPYDNLRTYHGYAFDWKATLEELYRITKSGGAVVWIVADQTKNGSESGTSFRQALYAMEIGFNLHDTMIWDKRGVTFPHEKLYHNCFEYMFVFAKGAIKTANLIHDHINERAGKKAGSSWREPDGTVKTKKSRIIEQTGRRFNIWRMPPVVSNSERTGHPAQFPLRLVSDHIISWSNEGDTVLDCFLGSGTTRIAAYDLNRNFIGYEIDPDYFQQQEERFSKHTAQISLFHLS